jgi:lactoylglutathione lyase
MNPELAHAIADGYERWAVSGDRTVMDMFSPDFYDNVSGRSGLGIFEVVESWLDASFEDRRVEHHATMFEGDRVMVWYTAYGRHIGNAFPRMADCQISGADIAWPQLHVFRVEGGLVVEHWAVRDDYGVVEQIKTAALASREQPVGRREPRLGGGSPTP